MSSALDSASLPQVHEKRTKASVLEKRIRQDIIGGRLKPGARLRLKDLASQYDSGQIPLREALSRLAASGFVTAQDQRGFVVVPVSKEELLDITRVRVFIECETLVDSIENGDVTWESHIVERHYRLERLPMIDSISGGLNMEWEKAHVEFHDSLLAACPSELLLRYCSTLRDQTSRYRSLSAEYSPEGKRDVAKEHRQLMDAVLRRDAVKASRLLAAHYERTTAALIKSAATD